MSENYLAEVRNQYENLPYPERNPEDESTRLLKTNLDHLLKINHFCYKGRANFSSNFKVLVAGGGTGDALIFLAEQLKTTNAKITYLDLSSASMSIAQKRARIRNLDNIIWRQESLLELNPKEHGHFNYVNCSGVLHHLENPGAGLLSLKSVLSPDGAIGIMVYAKYGRTAVYQIQDLMKLVNGSAPDMETKVKNAKSILKILPPTNWLKRSDELHSDHKRYGDIGIYDLFLHSRDRSYSIPQLMDWIDRCGLEFIDFAENKKAYHPASYINDKNILNYLFNRPKREQYAAAELISGSIIKHSFYCGTSKNTTVKLSDNACPIFGEEELQKDIIQNLRPEYYGEFYELRQNKIQLTIPITPITCELFKKINGKDNFGKIKKKISRKLKLNPDSKKELHDTCYKLINLLIDADRLYLSGSVQDSVSFH